MPGQTDAGVHLFFVTNYPCESVNGGPCPEYRDYVGAGWYVLPNPMYGSWTTVR